MSRVRAYGAWNLSLSLLKFFPWFKDFTPNIQQSNIVQVWVRLYGLMHECWHMKILFAIASSIRTPICSGIASVKPIIDITFKHYVRVLVDMNISSKISYKILVKGEGFIFFTDIEYENLPHFCTWGKKLATP